MTQMIKIEGHDAFFDLGSGYIGYDKIGDYRGTPIYSAETLLWEIEYRCFDESSAITLKSYEIDEKGIRRSEK